ncbi:GNAT family N-acetyltransferase [Streptomyces sp. 6N223]|uniref:GNAT family N-acetyltransferase n=1 Tax=Streptomyces sp. 6N223 TaxID=3457412 RepID=UPI003FD39A39
MNADGNGSLWAGRLVRLRGFAARDWEYFARFEEDSEDARKVHRIVPPRSDEAHQRETAEMAGRPADEEQVVLAIEDLADEATVGALSTFDVDTRAGRFRYGIAVDRARRRRGYATEAVGLLLRYMFDERRLHKCEAEVYAFNEASLRFHDRMGFTREGLLRDHEFFGGEHHDVVVVGITAPEFRRRPRP